MRKLLRTVGVGVVAGAVATGVMSAFMAAAKAVGGLGEPPPRKIVRRLTTRLGFEKPRGMALDLAGAAAHLAFGTGMATVFAAMPKRNHRISAIGFGLGVWLVSYFGVLPKLRLMPKPSRDRKWRPTSMALAHVVYGATLGEVSRLLSSSSQTTE